MDKYSIQGPPYSPDLLVSRYDLSSKSLSYAVFIGVFLWTSYGLDQE